MSHDSLSTLLIQMREIRRLYSVTPGNEPCRGYRETVQGVPLKFRRTATGITDRGALDDE
jgi:hypothetical protein